MSVISPTEAEIKAAIEFEVGKFQMKDFELWAFRRTPIVYDEKIPFIFSMSRSTKDELPENLVEAIAKIIGMWKRHLEFTKTQKNQL